MHLSAVITLFTRFAPYSSFVLIFLFGIQVKNLYTHRHFLNDIRLTPDFQQSNKTLFEGRLPCMIKPDFVLLFKCGTSLHVEKKKGILSEV